MIFGLDVSKYQPYNKFHSSDEEGISFFIIKALGKGKKVDPEAMNYINHCIRNNIPFGLYVYSYAKTNAEALDEAIAVINFVKEHGFEHSISLPIYIDIEENYQVSKITDLAYMFCKQIELAGFSSGLYTSASMFRYVDWGRLAGVSFWIARYFNDTPEPCAEKYLSTGFDVYQYTSNRHGLELRFDCNVADDDFIKGFNNIPSGQLEEAVEETKMTTIKKGSKGKAVKVWQVILGNVAIDGIFGNDTLAKTRVFQASHGLVNDGIVGRNTWREGLKTV